MLIIRKVLGVVVTGLAWLLWGLFLVALIWLFFDPRR